MPDDRETLTLLITLKVAEVRVEGDGGVWEAKKTPPVSGTHLH